MKRHTSHFRSEEAEGIILGDLTMNPLMIFFFLFIIVVLLLTLRTKTEETPTPVELGKILIEIEWPPGAIDVDLWLLEPGTGKPTGFSSRGGASCDLLRDDLGTTNDPMPGNHESIVCRTTPPGDYASVAYLFANNEAGHNGPVTVHAAVSAWNEVDHRFIRVHTSTLTLNNSKDYKTIVSFVVREDGTLDTESFNDIPREIFTGE